MKRWTFSFAAGLLLVASMVAPSAAEAIKIGSKNFTEQYILAEMYAAALENAGFEVRRKINLGGTLIAHQALTTGEIDLYPEYTGTALSAVVKGELSSDAQKLTVSYYVQQADRRLRTDVASLKIDGGRVRLKSVSPLSSTAFDLTPSNVLRTPTLTTNFDRTVVSCYDIGEYQTLARSRGDDDGVFAAWGDNRRTWTSPPDSPAAGTHAQPDVFTARVGDDD